MSTALELVKADAQIEKRRSEDYLSNVQRVGNILAASGYFSDIKDMAQAAVKVMAGEELGIAPVASVMGIHIIKGKVTLSANLIAAQVRRHGYDYKAIKFDKEGCKLQFIGKKGEALGESSFDEADAITAGVFSEMYKKFPRNMYFSRAMSNGAKWYCPEVTSGLPIYTPEEMGAKVDGEGDVIHEDTPIDTAGIDTGGHAVGTQAAADHVATETIRKQQEARKQSQAQPDPPAQAQQQRPPQQAQPAATQKTEEVPQPIREMWVRMVGIKGTTEVFAELKRDLIETIGEDAAGRFYYAVLNKQGVEHANQFKSAKPARIAARELHECIAAAQAPPVVDASALPDEWSQEPAQ